MARVYGNHNLDWIGNRLGAVGGPRLIEIVPDRKAPTMWRLRVLPDGKTGVRCNIVRARENARRMALAILSEELA